MKLELRYLQVKLSSLLANKQYKFLSNMSQQLTVLTSISDTLSLNLKILNNKLLVYHSKLNILKTVLLLLNSVVQLNNGLKRPKSLKRKMKRKKSRKKKILLNLLKELHLHLKKWMLKRNFRLKNLKKKNIPRSNLRLIILMPILPKILKHFSRLSQLCSTKIVLLSKHMNVKMSFNP